MAVRLPDPKQQLEDNDGNPLANGFMYTYAAGTSTPQATWQDANENALNTNPIQFDSAGRCNVWWDEDLLYRVIVTDSLGNILYTIEDFGAATGGSSVSGGGFGAATTIASQTTTDLGTVTSHFAVITGTTTINSFGSSASLSAPIYLCRVQSSGLTFTYGANLLNPLGVSIVSTQNDYFWTEYLGSGAWKIFDYVRGDGSIDATTVRCTNLVETGS